MRTERARPRAAALTVLILGCLALGFGLPVLKGREISGPFLLDPFLQLGSRHWTVLDGEQCVGEFAGTVRSAEAQEKEDGFTVRLEGSFLGRDAEQSEVYRLESLLSFSGYRMLRSVEFRLLSASAALEARGTNRGNLRGYWRRGSGEGRLDEPFPNGVLLLDREAGGFELALPRPLAALLQIPRTADGRLLLQVVESSPAAPCPLEAPVQAGVDVSRFFASLEHTKRAS